MASESIMNNELETLSIEGDATALFAALALAQKGFLPVAKSAEGQVGKGRFKYADYNTLTKCVRPSLTEQGIALIQPLHSRDGLAVTTTIIAGHGAIIKSSLAFEADPNPQEFGRHHTYYRRYQLQAILGLAGDDDADEPPMAGAQFSEPAKAEPKPAPKAKASAEPKTVAAAPSTPALPAPANGQQTLSTAQPSSAAQAPATVAPTNKPLAKANESVKTLNERLEAGMKELKWKMENVIAFYKEHVDPAGFEKAANLTVDQKSLLLDKMVSIKGIVPF